MIKKVNVEIYVYDNDVFTEEELKTHAKENALFHIENDSAEFSDWLEERYEPAEIFHFNEEDRFDVTRDYAEFIFNRYAEDSLIRNITIKVEV